LNKKFKGVEFLKMIQKMQKSKIFLGFSTHMVTDVYASFIVGMIPILTVKYGLSLFLVSVLTAVNFTSANLSQPIIGFLSDKYKIKYFLVLGPILASIFISLIGVAPAYWVVLILLFLGNIGVAAVHPPTAAIANIFGGRRKGFANSLISFGGALGFSLGSIFIIFIIERFGLVFTPLAAIPGLITAAITLKFAPDITLPNTSSNEISFLKRLRKVRKSKLLMLSIILFVSYSREIMSMTFITFLPLYLTNQGLKLINFGYFFMAFIIIGGIGGIIAGYYSDRIHKRHIVIQVLLLLALPCAYLITLVPINMSLVFFMLLGLFSISTLPLCTRMVQDLFPRNVSLASSLSIGVAAGSAAATIMLIGKIADIVGMVSIMRFAALFPLGSVLLLFLYPLIQKKNRHEQQMERKG
jgi:MFS transporter, FSR family, fosmidomycin resistance protein